MTDRGGGDSAANHTPDKLSAPEAPIRSALCAESLPPVGGRGAAPRPLAPAELAAYGAGVGADGGDGGDQGGAADA